MKKLLFVLLVVTIATIATYSTVLAGYQTDSLEGKYEFDNCFVKRYVGNGTLKIVSVPASWGFPGAVYVYGDDAVSNIKKVSGASVVVGDGFARVSFSQEGGEAHLSGQLDVSAYGARLDVSMRGNFDIIMGPRCTWEKNNEQHPS